MTYELLIGDRLHSSWSLRAWLMLERPGLPHRLHHARLYTPGFANALANFAPARLVPALRLPDGTVMAETLAIAETLAERHPDLCLWPDDPAARATARWLAAEMHAGFAALREACPMHLGVSYEGFRPPAEVQADLDRLAVIWAHARRFSDGSGPWLFGAWSLADAFFAPVATRVATYGLPMGDEDAAYIATQLADPAFRRWRAMGLADGFHQPSYDRALPHRPWPGPAPLPARAVENGPAGNAACPYSGRPVTHFLETGGRVFGFCNAFCRDKTVADPEAWPAFMKIYHS